MFERDYLMRMILQFAAALRRQLELARAGEADPQASAEAMERIACEAIGQDPDLALRLEGASIASIAQVSGVGASQAELAARTLLAVGASYAEAGASELAALRTEQARALARAYGIELGCEAPEAALEAHLASLGDDAR